MSEAERIAAEAWRQLAEEARTVAAAALALAAEAGALLMGTLGQDDAWGWWRALIGEHGGTAADELEER